MKIALVYDAAYPWMKGGGEKALWDIAVALYKRGHEVHLFSLRFWEGPAVIEREGVVLHGVRRARYFYARSGRRTWWQPLLFAFSLYRKLRRETGFDFIYCTVFPFFPVFSVWLHRLLSRCPAQWVLAWLEIWGRAYWKQYTGGPIRGAAGAMIEWLCARCCHNHIVLSAQQAWRLQTLLGVPSKEIHIIPRGLHLEKLPRSKPKKPRRVLYAGRLFDYKNVKTVLQGWPVVIRNFPDATFRIMGAGPELSRLKELCAELGAESSIEFVEPLESWEQAMEELAAAEIFVQPSVREGQSVVAIEAMAMGTVIVASHHEESAVSDFIEDGKNGLLVERWNEPEAWAKALNQLLDDTDLRSKLALFGVRTAQKYDWMTEVIPQLDALHSRIILGARRGYNFADRLSSSAHHPA